MTRRRAEILVVDDDPLVREILSRVLDLEDLTVRLAGSGERAVREAREQPPDAIVLGVELPDINGFEVCARLRAEAELSGIPVVLLADNDDDETREATERAGCAGYLAKPFSPLMLIDTLRALVAGLEIRA